MGCDSSQFYEENIKSKTSNLMLMPTKAELMHYRLQAMIREYNFSELEYLGVRPDSIGVDQHWYRIGKAEVPVDAITELDSVEEVDESDSI